MAFQTLGEALDRAKRLTTLETLRLCNPIDVESARLAVWHQVVDTGVSGLATRGGLTQQAMLGKLNAACEQKEDLVVAVLRSFRERLIGESQFGGNDVFGFLGKLPE